MSTDPPTAAPARDDTAGVVAPPPLIYIGGLAIGFVLEVLLPSASLPGALRWPVGSVLAVAGLALAASFFRALSRARTPVDPYRPTTALVTTGPYRLTRNPAYVAMLLGYLAVVVLSSALWPLVSLVPTLALVDRGVIVREERYLEARFGDEYRRYRGRTRRWV